MSLPSWRAPVSLAVLAVLCLPGCWLRSSHKHPSTPTTGSAESQASDQTKTPDQAKPSDQAPPDAAEPDGPTGDHLDLASLPKPVRATIEREAKGRTVDQVSGTRKHGHLQYTAQVAPAAGSPTLHLQVAGDGTLIGRDDLLQNSQAEHGKAPAVVAP